MHAWHHGTSAPDCCVFVTPPPERPHPTPRPNALCLSSCSWDLLLPCEAAASQPSPRLPYLYRLLLPVTFLDFFLFFNCSVFLPPMPGEEAFTLWPQEPSKSGRWQRQDSADRTAEQRYNVQTVLRDPPHPRCCDPHASRHGAHRTAHPPSANRPRLLRRRPRALPAPPPAQWRPSQPGRCRQPVARRRPLVGPPAVVTWAEISPAPWLGRPAAGHALAARGSGSRFTFHGRDRYRLSARRC